MFGSRDMLRDDKSASVSAIAAVTAMPVVGLLFAASATGVHSVATAAVQRAIESACSRALAHTAAVANDREDLTRDVLERHLGYTDLDLAQTTYSAVQTGSGLEVQVAGPIDSVVGGLGGTNWISATTNCDAGAGNAASSPFIFFDSFEVPDVRDSGFTDWYVEPALPNWRRVSGTGAGMHRYPVDGRSAYDGMQYVELDSSASRGGVSGESTNTVIARTVALAAGYYRLSYAYHPQEMVGVRTDVGIATYLDPAGSPGTPNNELARLSASVAGWQIVSVDFPIATSGEYDLSFAPLGPANGRSGYIDAVRLEQLAY